MMPYCPGAPCVVSPPLLVQICKCSFHGALITLGGGGDLRGTVFTHFYPRLAL
ncbi:unnamed protein product, partial [Staurois parvus]